VRPRPVSYPVSYFVDESQLMTQIATKHPTEPRQAAKFNTCTADNANEIRRSLMTADAVVVIARHHRLSRS